MLLFVFSLLSVLQAAATQQIGTLAGRCDRQTAYFFGTCRVRACLTNETFLQGSSFCDVYRAYLRTPYVRCAASLPCCAHGGQCRQICSPGENQLAVQTDCSTGQRGVCCATNTRAIVPEGSTPPPTSISARPDSRIPVALRQGECGTRTSVRARIIGGRVSQPTTWPWVVRLAFLGNAPGVCAGVLVDNDTVLTVAHCVARTSANQLQVRIGDFDLAQTEPDEEVVGVRNIELNRNFVPGRRGNDFALLKLARPVNFTQNKLPICLPDPTTPLARPLRCFVAGWGVTETGQVGTQLRVSPVTFMDPRLCNVMHASTSSNSTSLGNDTICTEPSRNNTGGCLFDDGGMLSCLDIRNRYTLVGLVAEYSCGSLPTVYTRVDNYTEDVLSRL